MGLNIELQCLIPHLFPLIVLTPWQYIPTFSGIDFNAAIFKFYPFKPGVWSASRIKIATGDRSALRLYSSLNPSKNENKNNLQYEYPYCVRILLFTSGVPRLYQTSRDFHINHKLCINVLLHKFLRKRLNVSMNIFP